MTIDPRTVAEKVARAAALRTNVELLDDVVQYVIEQHDHARAAAAWISRRINKGEGVVPPT